LCPQLLVLNKLTGVFHGQNHGAGVIPLGRRRLALFDVETADFHRITLFQMLQELQEFRVHTHIFGLLIFRVRLLLCSIRRALGQHLQIPFVQQHLEAGEEPLAPHLGYQLHLLVFRRRIKDGQETPGNYLIDLLGYRIQTSKR